MNSAISTKQEFIKNHMNIDFYSQFISESEAAEIFNHLEKNVPWKKVGKTQQVSNNKRSNVTYGEGTYKINWYGTTTYRKALPWTEMPILLDIKERAQQLTGTRYNICVIQRYPTGRIGIKPHRDKEMTPETTIMGISLGATRKLRMTYQGESLTLDLNPGSAYCLNPPTNDYWAHCILEDSSIQVPRISLTFRNYKSLF